MAGEIFSCYLLLAASITFSVNSVPYNYTQEDSWAFISDGVCNADNTIKLGEASLVLLTSDVERQTGEIQQDLSCSLSLLVPEAHNDGIAVSAAGSMSCANAISIEGRCTKSNCEEEEVTCEDSEKVVMYGKELQRLTVTYSVNERSSQDNITLTVSRTYNLPRQEAGVAKKLAKGVVIIIVIAVIVVILCIVGIPVLICCGCCGLLKKHGSGRDHHHCNPEPVVYRAAPPAGPTQPPPYTAYGQPQYTYR